MKPGPGAYVDAASLGELGELAERLNADSRLLYDRAAAILKGRPYRGPHAPLGTRRGHNLDTRAERNELAMVCDVAAKAARRWLGVMPPEGREGGAANDTEAQLLAAIATATYRGWLQPDAGPPDFIQLLGLERLLPRVAPPTEGPTPP